VDEGHREAGRRVRVYAGTASDPLPSPGEAGQEHRFKEVVGFTPRFGAQGIDLRLVDPNGRTTHTHRFLPATGYTNVPFHMVRSADGTGLILLQPAGGAAAELQPGEYRLRFSYRRDNRAPGEDGLVLSQNGETTPETATLDVPWETLAHEGRQGLRAFDVQFYLAAYPDLQAAFGTNYVAALIHWISQGLPVEGRRSSAAFDVQFYLAAYPDLQAAFGTNYVAALDHWISQGLPHEGRRSSAAFDVQFYLATYPDLQTAFGTNYVAALIHWISQGLPHEGRRGSREFDVQFYLATYPDLQTAFGTNYVAALDHWVSLGISEGRKGVP
jgi:hypothetical protein